MKIDLRQGDCLELMKDIPDGSVDLVVTSPPYNMGKEYEKKTSLKLYIDWQRLVIFEKAPEEIHNISHSQLSVARHFGGCKYMGASYHYDSSQDALIRMDVWQKRMHEDSAAGKAARDAERAKWEALQAKLF